MDDSKRNKNKNKMERKRCINLFNIDLCVKEIERDKMRVQV